MTTELPFWRRKTLAEMSHDEWESLCDGCGKCCLHKLEDEETGEIVYTDVACRLLDLTRCRCRHYRRRHELVPGCARLGPDRLDELRRMPSSCAYRLLHEGKDLPWWHPLSRATAAPSTRRRPRCASGRWQRTTWTRASWSSGWFPGRPEPCEAGEMRRPVAGLNFFVQRTINPLQAARQAPN